ncbi:MAG: shikimate kinase [Candidatus Marinimicrobia bacterium]|nr:shikimate kinase [Candidatus Neomarinimicrobiota bacterium]
MNIFIIGMMGSGKTTVGKQLAKKLNMSFVDIDETVEMVTGMSISEIFEIFGEEKFREMESAFFIEKSKQDHQIFSTGGGIVLRSENRNILKTNGTTILLRNKPETLTVRLKSSPEDPSSEGPCGENSRPLLYNSFNLNDRLTKIWNERKSYYESSAKYIIDTDELTYNEVVKKIARYLQN